MTGRERLMQEAETITIDYSPDSEVIIGISIPESISKISASEKLKIIDYLATSLDVRDQVSFNASNPS